MEVALFTNKGHPNAGRRQRPIQNVVNGLNVLINRSLFITPVHFLKQSICKMAYHQVTATSLTPSRPAPQAPMRRGTENSGSEYSINSSSTSGYNSPFSFTPSSPSASSYAFPYSGIGASPNRGPDDAPNSQIVRSGSVSMKEDSFGNWLFQRKWLILREQILSIHKNEVRFFF